MNTDETRMGQMVHRERPPPISLAPHSKLIIRLVAGFCNIGEGMKVGMLVNFGRERVQYKVMILSIRVPSVPTRGPIVRTAG
jgi:hypothetical protein